VRVDTPWGDASDEVLVGRLGGVPVAFLPRHGRGHVHSPSTVPYRANIDALKRLGCTDVVSVSAVGSLREDYAPGDFVLVDQYIDRTFAREASFFGHGCVAHVGFAHPVCARLSEACAVAATGVTVHRGAVYLAMEGPQFSTLAESRMYRAWGADVIGMTGMPEAKLAREAEIAYALVALPTDYDCWREPTGGHHLAKEDLLTQIIGNLNKATRNGMALIKAALADVSILSGTPSPAHAALKLAIWSDKGKIDPAEVERLRPLWGRYF